MRDTLGKRRLTDIVIPGTHDSGTYGITSSSAIASDGKGIDSINDWVAKKRDAWYGPILDGFGIFDLVMDEAAVVTSWWAKVQQNNFLTQMQDGVRYFDLRVQQWDATTFYCVHSLKGANLETDLLAGIKTFYSHPETGSEILILDFQHTFQVNHANFVTLLKKSLVDAAGNSLMIPRGADLNVQSIWNTKKRVLVFYDDDATVAAHPELWYSSSAKTPQIHSPWPNTNNRTVLYDFLGDQLSDATNLARKSGEFVIMQALSTEHWTDVVLSLEAHLYNLESKVPILGKIITRLGFNHIAPMNFFEFNFGGVVLADWLNTSAARNGAAHRANILIIDDYANFRYKKADGSQGGYLNLVTELNTSRAAPSPQGPYQAAVAGQTANFTAGHYKTYPVQITFTNTGSVAWDPTVVYLGTAGPHDRTTHLYTNDGNWVSQTRIRMQNTAAVQPGQQAVFKFSITPDDAFASSYQSFELVADKVYQSYPIQWFGEAYGNTAIYITTDVLAYASHLKSHSGSTTIPQFDTVTLTATFTNTGNMPWFPDVVFLGIPYPYWFSGFYTPGNNWESNRLIRMQNTAVVMPGQDATFSFDATANLGQYGGTFSMQLAATKAAGLMPAQAFGSQGNVSLAIPIEYIQTPGNFAGELVQKSPDCTIQRGKSQQLTMVFKNTGKITWYPDLVSLNTYPYGSASNLYTDDGYWFSNTEIALVNTVPVKPGDLATFVLTATPDSQAASGPQTFQINLKVPGVGVWNAGTGAQGTIKVTVTN